MPVQIQEAVSVLEDLFWFAREQDRSRCVMKQVDFIPVTSSSLHLSFAYPVLTGGALVFPVSRPTFFIPVHPLRIFLLYDFIFTVGLSPLECKLCVAKSCSVFSALIVPAPGTAQ